MPVHFISIQELLFFADILSVFFYIHIFSVLFVYKNIHMNMCSSISQISMGRKHTYPLTIYNYKRNIIKDMLQKMEKLMYIYSLDNDDR